MHRLCTYLGVATLFTFDGQHCPYTYYNKEKLTFWCEFGTEYKMGMNVGKTVFLVPSPIVFSSSRHVSPRTIYAPVQIILVRAPQLWHAVCEEKQGPQFNLCCYVWTWRMVFVDNLTFEHILLYCSWPWWRQVFRPWTPLVNGDSHPSM